MGNALTKEMQEEDMKIMLEMGAHTMRMAHYQHDQYFYDLADRYGMIVWAVSNEITVSSGVTEDIMENHHMLNDLCHHLDPDRMTTMANVFMLETEEENIKLPDIRSYNLYYGWYVGELEELIEITVAAYGEVARNAKVPEEVQKQQDQMLFIEQMKMMGRLISEEQAAHWNRRLSQIRKES